VPSKDFALVHGDGREFSSNSEKTQSRAWIWISATTGKNLGVGFNTSTLKDLATGSWQTYGPMKMDDMTSRLLDDGSIELIYDLVIGTPESMEGIAPQLNGRIFFYPNASGGYDYKMYRDGYPSAEAYLYDSGSLKQTIFQSNALSENPLLLFGYESYYGEIKNTNNNLHDVLKFAFDYFSCQYMACFKPRIDECNGGHKC